MEIPSYVNRLKEACGAAIEEVSTPLGDLVVLVKADQIVEALNWLKEDEEALFDHFMDLTAVDYIGREPRFEVVIHLVSIPKSQRIRIKVHLDEDDPVMPTITPVYPAANWFERECWDLYGVHFTGHPNLTRIMLYEGFKGHPLRKDYPIKKTQPLMELRKPEVRRSDEAFEPGKNPNNP
ncbi:NADH-quinone oxidoreductase subunit C [bacterium]|nr:NADH-quinone oxidoreductase subunit C [bacterium]MBU1651072.1 NADH-quinone oxidoreductase subunit C [bacterium]